MSQEAIVPTEPVAEAKVQENGVAEAPAPVQQDAPMEPAAEQPAAPVEAEAPAAEQKPVEESKAVAEAPAEAEPAADQAPAQAVTAPATNGATTRQRSGKATPARSQLPKMAPKPISKAKGKKKGKGVAAKKPLMTLYGYWRSGCTWRVRLALALKGFALNKEVEYMPVHLVKDGGEQKKESYSKLNPAQMVPTLINKDKAISKKPITLTESMAICEWLEEAYPSKRKLLPKDPFKRFQVRRLCEMINAGTQPVQNLSVLSEVATRFGAEHRQPWAQWAIVRGFTAFEQQVESTKGKYCLGNIVTLADVFLPAMVYNAERQQVDMSQFPNISAIMDNLKVLPEFANAHPSKQPDAQE